MLACSLADQQPRPDSRGACRPTFGAANLASEMACQHARWRFLVWKVLCTDVSVLSLKGGSMMYGTMPWYHDGDRTCDCTTPHGAYLWCASLLPTYQAPAGNPMLPFHTESHIHNGLQT